MTLLSRFSLSRPLAAFRRDERGNVAVIFAAALLPMLMFIGSAIDYGHALMTKASLNTALDSAALAGAREYVLTFGDIDASKAAAALYFKQNYIGNSSTVANLDDSEEDVEGANSSYRLVVSVDKESRVLTATATTEVPTAFMGVVGVSTLTVSNTVTSAFGDLQPVSVGMVLDVSGSMAESMPGAANRMASLKSASKAMLDILDEANPTGENVRTGLTTFSTNLVDRVDFAFGSSRVRRQIDRLRPTNMTQINAGLDPMVDMIEAEKTAFSTSEPLRFVILMTDGYSTVNPRKDVRNTLATCSALKKADVEVFTVNLNGDADTLRSCASGDDHFFDTTNHSQFKKAFEAIALDILARSIRLAS